MHIKTHRFDVELTRSSLFVRIELKAGRRWETFRDWFGQGPVGSCRMAPRGG
jgi:hypothetical protein